MNSINKAYILLGRYGDLVNFLPVLKYDYDTIGKKSKIIVAKEYADLFESVSYAEPIIFNGHYRDYPTARNFAYNKLQDCKIIDVSVSGNGYKLAKRTTSFVRESWRLSGCPIPWGYLPVIIDIRNFEREKKLVNSVLSGKNKPIVLVNLEGNSSPLKIDLKNKLMDQLRKLQDDFEVINLPRAEKFVDLLGLFEKANYLVTIDTGTLHLARAVPKLKVISLISDLKDEWHQSAWHPQDILRIFYSENDRYQDIPKIILSDYNEVELAKINFITSYSIGNANPTRYDFAFSTRRKEMEITGRWNVQYFDISLGVMKRSAGNIGDVNNLPYIKDMIEFACTNKDDDDIVMICNADICFVPGITGWILEKVERYKAVYFHRYDFDKLDRPLINEYECQQGKWYCGSDAFAFKVSWWKENREIYPDMIFAREAWDMVFRNMIRRAGGTEIFRAIYHQKHQSFWYVKENRNCAGNTHNCMLAKEWLDKYGGDWNDWKKEGSLKYK